MGGTQHFPPYLAIFSSSVSLPGCDLPEAVLGVLVYMHLQALTQGLIHSAHT